MKMKRMIAPLALFLTVISLAACFGLKVSAQECTENGEALYTSRDIKASSRIYELLFASPKSRGAVDKTQLSRTAVLCPGGDVFGVRIKQGELTVVNSKCAQITAGDVIISIDGKPTKSVAEVKEILKSHSGGECELVIRHKGERRTVKLTPEESGGELRLGLGLRDSAAGIGTVTFYEPKTGLFGGLGHGICDSESGEVIAMNSGKVTDVILGGVTRGAVGKPGELCGVLTNDECGELYLNCECGVFGRLDKSKLDGRATLPIATRTDVHDGEAKIISTVKNGKKCEYAVKLYDIDKTSEGTKSFKVKVTDKALLAMTGGIVRGMSGSPIIQDGKLVGAVTHVMVADPTEGYGIFIENMLNASLARNELPKAA